MEDNASLSEGVFTYVERTKTRAPTKLRLMGEEFWRKDNVSLSEGVFTYVE